MCAPVCDIHLRGICKISSFPAPESLWMIPSVQEWLIQARSIHYCHAYYAGAMRAHVFVISICEVFAKWAHFQHMNHFEWYHLRMRDSFKLGVYTILTCMMQVEYVCTYLWYPSATFLKISSFLVPELLWMAPSAHEWLMEAREMYHSHLHDAGGMSVYMFVIFICEVFPWCAHFLHPNHVEWQHVSMSNSLTRGIHTILTCMMQVECMFTWLWCPSARCSHN